MSETPTTPPAPEQAPAAEVPKPQAPAMPAPDGRNDQPERDWKDRFEAQQKVNRDLEAKFNGLRDGLKTALGIEDKKVDGTELVTTLQQQVAAMQRDNLVNDVARRHGITDDEHVELLRALPDAEAMQRLANVLKTATTPQAPNAPAPDPSQGSAPLTPEAAEQAEYEAFFPSTTPSK